MFHTQGALKHTCNLLAVVCSEPAESKRHNDALEEEKRRFPFPEIASSGRLEVQTLKNPSPDEFRKALDSWQPNLVYLQGKQLENEEVGSISWGGVELSSPEAVSGLFSSTMPTTVYLEVPNGEKLAKSLHSKGVSYVIYWKNSFSCYAASHFRNALLSVIQSSSCHTWDAFQLADASFRLYCLRNNCVLPDGEKVDDELGPNLFGEPPRITIDIPEIEDAGEDEESTSGSLPAIKIYDDDVNMRFLICGMASSLDARLLSPLEDGLNALLSIEMRGSKLHNRVSALPPPLQAGTFSRGVVTMRCDLSTSSSAHISLLVSGSAQTCFDDQLLENHIKSELIDKSELIHALPNTDENKPPTSEPRRSVSVACGAAVFEVCMRVPTWASQVLRQLAPDVSYRNLVALGIASIQGLAVASFEREDAERLLFFFSRQGKNGFSNNIKISSPPSWLRPPPPSRKRPSICQEISTSAVNGRIFVKKEDNGDKELVLSNGISLPSMTHRRRIKIAALRPIPHVRHQKMLPFSRISDADVHDGGGQVKANLPAPPAKHNAGTTPASHRKSTSSSYQAKQVISLNPLPLKKHGCGRSPLHVCSEEEFLKDVMQFLILRGHNRLIPQGGLAEFPDAILNAKRLDLFNLYREVVTRGGFHVGNGINWKGQVFSKMRNHTVTNRMTGVGNTLKRHYETYLLEYELAHDDVDGECCLLCHSSAPGDWVNCGLCGEWAHFGCDRRPGLGAFKDYAKTDGLEYICPQCSVSNYKKKMNKSGNGYS
ncbi:AT-rich interactive domain-containing protein 4-like [Salvia miltiorrhiza]|uniref:AT-rich interactive domain-containing protein 4-like n=1 Tax=Salvia miltiorrhiza TaxID=226208 RepID=UPI0025ACD6DF|nr:AT-rich interactive domain-containing protein 4-like [Salvia miltiorrhiza]XP_057770660.1 AT-rich interactive domain-containing protein 4-like [Salvia miltiorrhiza]